MRSVACHWSPPMPAVQWKPDDCRPKWRARFPYCPTPGIAGKSSIWFWAGHRNTHAGLAIENRKRFPRQITGRRRRQVPRLASRKPATRRSARRRPSLPALSGHWLWWSCKFRSASLFSRRLARNWVRRNDAAVRCTPSLLHRFRCVQFQDARQLWLHGPMPAIPGQARWPGSRSDCRGGLFWSTAENGCRFPAFFQSRYGHAANRLGGLESFVAWTFVASNKYPLGRLPRAVADDWLAWAPSFCPAYARRRRGIQSTDPPWQPLIPWVKTRSSTPVTTMQSHGALSGRCCIDTLTRAPVRTGNWRLRGVLQVLLKILLKSDYQSVAQQVS